MVRAIKAVAKRALGRQGRATVRALRKSKVRTAAALVRGLSSGTGENLKKGLTFGAGGAVAYKLLKSSPKDVKVKLEVRGARQKKGGK